MTDHNPNGAILWRGPSRLDGAPIVVIATGLAHASANGKTGDQVQVSYLRADLTPQAAVKLGADASICGQCEFRPILAEPGAPRCYVNLGHGPRGVYAAFERGRYRDASADPGAVVQGRSVRLGAYGDPASAPYGLAWALSSAADSHTGFTHQWRTCDQRFARVCMASVSSAAEAAEAQAMGWRTFRVAASGSADLEGEAHCQASAERGKRTTCAECRACGGTSAKARCDIVIWNHDATGAAATRRFKLTHTPA